MCQTNWGFFSGMFFLFYPGRGSFVVLSAAGVARTRGSCSGLGYDLPKEEDFGGYRFRRRPRSMARALGVQSRAKCGKQFPGELHLPDRFMDGRKVRPFFVHDMKYEILHTVLQQHILTYLCVNNSHYYCCRQRLLIDPVFQLTAVLRRSGTKKRKRSRLIILMMMHFNINSCFHQ